ncbi:hypothetical protein, conserved [Eimeria brunetti]|uniref:Uncharacterized protein n=1 Tax=Eimeria brunetti TaxID=51314 RepID=U6LNW5_9EIME|nr:hypothetical protein, conserved [Eimeria brunetti]
MVGTQSIDEMQHQQHRQQQQHKLQQQQQPERKQQVLVDQFSNAVQSAVVVPAYDGKNNPDYDNGQGKETGEEKGGDDGNDESGGEGDKNDVIDDSDNDDNDANGHTDHSDDTNDDNSDGGDAGDEGAAEEDDNSEDDGDNDDGKNNDNKYGDADDDYDGTGDDNNNVDDGAAAAAAAAADDDNGDDTDREEGEVEETERGTKTETETPETSAGGDEDYDDGDDRRRNLPDDDENDDEDDNDEDDADNENDEDDDEGNSADEGTSAAALAAVAAVVPADYDKPLDGALVVQRQEQKIYIRNSNSSKGKTPRFSSQGGPSYPPYQVAIIVDPPGRMPARLQAEMRERRRRKGRKEQHFQKQFIFTAGKPNAKGAYMVVCKEIYYQGTPSLLLYWMPFLDKSVAGKQQQLQRQQQQQQQNLAEHPFFRLPSVSPSASVRSYTKKAWTSKQKSALSGLNAVLAIRGVLKKQEPLTSEDLLKLLEKLEHLVEYSVRQGQEVVDHIRPAYAVKKLGTALLTTDAMLAAAEVLGDNAKKNEWWQDVIAALPVYRRPTVAAAGRHASQQSLMLVQLLQTALDMYKGGQRPPPLFLVPLKQILLCTEAVRELRKTSWTRFQPDDEEWQLEQAKQQQENVKQQHARQL